MLGEKLRVYGKWTAIGLVAFAGGAGVAFAIPDSSGVINACYNTQSGDAVADGTLRAVENSSADCSTDEAPLNWNQSGPAGPPGAPGPTGQTGPSGTGGERAPIVIRGVRKNPPGSNFIPPKDNFAGNQSQVWKSCNVYCLVKPITIQQGQEGRYLITAKAEVVLPGSKNAPSPGDFAKVTCGIRRNGTYNEEISSWPKEFVGSSAVRGFDMIIPVGVHAVVSLYPGDVMDLVCVESVVPGSRIGSSDFTMVRLGANPIIKVPGKS